MVPTIVLADLMKLKDETHKLVYMVLLLSIKDKVSEVRYEPVVVREHEVGFVYEPGYYKLSYCHEGTFYNMVPPPQHLHKRICHAFRKIGGFASPRFWFKRTILKRGLTETGRFRADLGGSVVEMVLTIAPTKLGESVVVKLIEPENPSQRAHAILEDYRKRHPVDLKTDV